MHRCLTSFLKRNIHEKNHTAPFCRAFSHNIRISKHWFTKIADSASIGLVVQQFIGSCTTRRAKPVEQETGMSKCPRPPWTVGGKFNTHLITEKMHKCTSQRSNTPHSVFHQRISMTLWCRVCLSGWKTHTEPSIHHHPLQLK